MASLDKRGGKWRARVYVKGVRESKTFRSKTEAATWGLQREADLTHGRLPRHTIGDALKRYAEKVSPTKRGGAWEAVRLAKLGRDPQFASILLENTKADTVAAWRDRRLTEVSGASVGREMNLLKSVFKIARLEWRWLRDDPMADVSRPPRPRARRRRITQDEISRIRLALGYPQDTSPQTLSQRVAMAFLFAIETGMRAGEILTIEWAQVHLKQRFVHLDKTKNGDERDVALSAYAVKLLKRLPASEGSAFGLASASRDALFRKARMVAQIPNLHFHDTRSEAISRLSKKLDVLQLARMVGHRELKSLMSYYAEHASETAKRL